MKDINELRSSLASVFADLRAGTITPKDASELNNCAGKIINSLKVELEYKSFRDGTPNIDYLNVK